jgi:hypothetical protein
MTMNRFNEEERGQPPDDVHCVLLKTAMQLTTNGSEAETVLQQCADYFRNKRLLQTHAASCGLNLVNESISECMQIYFEVQAEGAIKGFISCGWDEPGFRVGQVVMVPIEHMPELQLHAQEIMQLLARNGIAITTDPDDEQAVHYLNLTINIPDAGFNAATLSQAVWTMNACVEQIKKTIPCK